MHRWDPTCPPPRRLVRPVRVDPAGVTGPTRGQANGPRWRRSSHGFYVPSEVDGSVPEQRILEQSVRLPPEGAVTGWAACRLAGAGFFDGVERDGRTRIPVPLAVGPRARPRPDAGIVISRERLDATEVTVLHGVPCTEIRRALFDEMRRTTDLREAVVSMDMAAAAELVSLRRMRAFTDLRSGWTRVAQVRTALDLADERSRSPNETRLRLVWMLDAGLPRPMVNQPVWDLSGGLLGIADLLDPAAGVVGEYDGADHRQANRHSKDVDREARFRDHGLELFRVTGPDMLDIPLVVARIKRAHDRARWVPPERRTWTIDPPRGERAEPGLDEILAEREATWALYAQWEREDALRARRLP